MSRYNNSDWKCTCDYAEICQLLSEKVHSQYVSGYKSISMEGVELDQFNTLKSTTIPMEQLNSHLSDEIDQDLSTTDTRFCITIWSILTKGMKYTFMKTMWDHTDNLANKYRFVSDIYLLSRLAL